MSIFQHASYHYKMWKIFLLPALSSLALGLFPAVTFTSAEAETTSLNHSDMISNLQDFKEHAGISDADKFWVASQIYHYVKTYFAHWAGLPDDYDFDQHYQDFLQKIIPIHSRWAFDKEALKLFASLKNGHTGFWDRYLNHFEDLPFRIDMSSQGEWAVARSSVPDLEKGAIIQTIDGQDFGNWLKKQEIYVSGSSEFGRLDNVLSTRYLWPDRFSLGLSDGKKIAVNLGSAPYSRIHPIEEAFQTSEVFPGVYILKLPSFMNPAMQENATAFLKTHQNAKAILFDVRGNGGGSTPGILITSLMTKPLRNLWADTPQIIGTNDAHLNDGNVSALPNTMLRAGGNLEQPKDPSYFGKIYVVTDHYCASACEDFLLYIKLGKRGVILGENSFGSTGQPYYQKLPKQHYSFRVGSRRYYYQDGTPFEGVGVTPDIPLQNNLKEEDSLLKQAVNYVKADLAKPEKSSP